MKTKKSVLGISIIAMMYVLTVSFIGKDQDKWVAPKEADKLQNPVAKDDGNIKKGKNIYRQMCAVCHGVKGKGDGMAGAGLNPKPANFTTSDFQSQTDGAIFWKITEGRSPMASYKGTLSETQRWQVINYLRTLKK